MMIAYLNDPELTNELKRQSGWLCTGDLAEIGQDGHYRIVGRNQKRKKVIVIGVPDVVLQNEICACIILKDEEDVSKEDIHNFCVKNMIEDADPTLLSDVTHRNVKKGSTSVHHQVNQAARDFIEMMHESSVHETDRIKCVQSQNKSEKKKENEANKT